MKHVLIEFKARCSDLSRIREIIKAKDPRVVGTDHQVDTYFNVPRGRLKLREGNVENSLVYYERENQAGPKRSNVTLAHVQPGSNLREVLAAALGVKVAVDKQREIYFVGNVKIHLDEVKDLGTFVEIEAIGTAENVAQLRDQAESFLRELGIADADLIAVSYSDLLMPAAAA